MSNSDYWAGQQSANSLRLWDDQRNRRTARRTAEWQTYAGELEAKIQQIRSDRDEAIASWKLYSEGLADKLKKAEGELQKALNREAVLLDQLDAAFAKARKP